MSVVSGTSFPLRGTALVTGASAGLGAQFADFLARSGMDLLLTARRKETLDAQAKRLRERHGRRVSVLPADLTAAAARIRLLKEVDDLGTPISVLVNNAGFGSAGRFVEHDTDRVTREVELNCVAPTHLARHLLPGMLERGYGAVVNVASAAAYQPIPSMAVYAATKSYLLSLSQALWSETAGTGVRVVAVCPGPTDTDFFVNTGEPDAMTWRRTPEQVVQSTFRALYRNQPSVVDGGANAVLAKLSQMLPVRIVLPISKLYAQPRRRR
ncbi:hypothetical protein CGZ93_07125 [Enemella dayhoffiae]|uniref:Ketoreductase domain-containing protein n=1 Tax=Enemella dayhoffiae TaxID=2016507 RepID=A0A255H523_9ACTN|nr:SDR family oxidoreductase [Enemella dayhoffiae]OYO22808.1 hypothetical protein CGZ93_07125 [Enemella dayhoffiae]